MQLLSTFKETQNSNRVQFNNIIDTVASNETHIARFEYIYELTNKIYCGLIHCRIKSKPRINIRSMKDQTKMLFFLENLIFAKWVRL